MCYSEKISCDISVSKSDPGPGHGLFSCSKSHQLGISEYKWLQKVLYSLYDNEKPSTLDFHNDINKKNLTFIKDLFCSRFNAKSLKSICTFNPYNSKVDYIIICIAHVRKIRFKKSRLKHIVHLDSYQFAIINWPLLYKLCYTFNQNDPVE